MYLHQPSAGMYSLPLESGLSLLLAMTTKMWKKGSGLVLGLVLRVSAFSLEEAGYHVRNLATLNYHAIRKPKLVSHVEISLCGELKNSAISVQRPRHLAPVKLCKLVLSCFEPSEGTTEMSHLQ